MNVLSLMLLFLVGCASSKDSVDQALKASDFAAPEKPRYDAQFLVEMTDARLMDYQEGKLAARRGTTKVIRAYGRKMERDQTVLLKEMTAIAKAEKVVLPEVIGSEKREALEDLEKLRGKEFDRKFISMISIDHRRDVAEFKKASERLSNVSPPVMDFATAKLPLIQSHLDQAEALSSP
jgi:putative membrane protein